MVNPTAPNPSETNGAPNASPKGVGRFLRFSLIYGLGDLLAKGARIVLIPFYLGVMTQAEIGELAILQAISFCAWTILGFGLSFGVQKYYYQYEGESSSDSSRLNRGDAMASSIWLARLVGGLPIFAVMLLLGSALHRFSGESLPLDLVLLSITGGYLRGGINITENWLNIREEPVKYRAFTFGQFLLTSLLILYLVAVQKLGVAGVVWGELISYAAFVVISAVMMFRRALPKFTAVQWKEMLAYCLPIMPHSFFMWGLIGVDRLILNEYVDRAEIGLYSVAFLLGSFLSIVVRSMRAAWLPSYFKHAHDADSNQQFGKIASIYLILTFFTALSGMYFSPEIVALFSLTSKVSYAASARIMQFLLVGFVSMAVFLAVNQPLLFERRTGLLSTISGTGLLVNIVINLWLVPQMGVWGAVAAYVLAYSLMAVITLVVTKKIYQIQWEASQMLATTTVFFLFCLGAWFVPVDTKLWLVPFKLVILGLFAFLMLYRIEVPSGPSIKIQPRFAWSQLWKKNAKSVRKT